MSCLITMSQKELNRLKTVQQIRDNQLRVVEAAALLGLSRSQVHRMGIVAWITDELICRASLPSQDTVDAA